VTKAKTNTPTSRTGWGGYVRNASIFARITAAVVIAVCAQNLSATEIRFADAVIVKKAERKIYLVTGGQVLKSFKISLGWIPDGDKMQEGDFRTPEGRYELTDRNADSDFFLSIQISYPNRLDQERAAELGVAPGGQIMIHGQPNRPRYSKAYYGNYDWTNGCIALSNADMMDLWRMTTPKTPIYIVP
jgi:murein L,D-transpeptidase YafK